MALRVYRIAAGAALLLLPATGAAAQVQGTADLRMEASLVEGEAVPNPFPRLSVETLIGEPLVPSGSVEALATAPVASVGPFDGSAIGETALGRIAGRQDSWQVAQSNNVATVTNNRIGDNSSTGEVRITDNAFQNVSGLAIISINSGNNVAVNAALNVNLSITPNP